VLDPHLCRRHPRYRHAGQLSDAARGDLLGEAVAEVEAFELTQLALTIAADRGGFADRVELALPARSR
jgi:hypothetical protein